MPRLTPDQSFYPSPTMAMAAEPEKLAYVAMLNSDPQQARRAGRRRSRSRVDAATASWSARWTCRKPATSCTTSAGTPAARACARHSPHPHMERRYLVVPGMRSSRIHILDTKPDPRKPRLVKVIEAEEVAQAHRLQPAAHVALRPRRHLHERARRRPTAEAPAASSCSTPRRFDIRGRWEVDRGPQQLAYDFWWHLGHDTMITSEWGTPNMVEDGVNPGAAARRQVRPRAARLGPAQAHAPAGARPRRRAADGARAAAGARPDRGLRLRRRRDVAEGSVGVGLALVSRRAATAAQWEIRKVIEIPAEPADAEPAAAAAQGLRRGAAARHRHQPVARRPVPLRLLLGHGRAASVRRVRSVQPEADRHACTSAGS